jgi:hypothetical protein
VQWTHYVTRDDAERFRIAWMTFRRSTVVLLTLLLGTLGCTKPPELTRQTAQELIVSSGAFRLPIDSSIVFIETKYTPSPDTRREFIRLEGLTIKPDGPFGMAGATATVAFSWRWNKGPLAGTEFHSKAKLNSTGAAWRIYEDYLEKEFSKAERSQE